MRSVLEVAKRESAKVAEPRALIKEFLVDAYNICVDIS